MITNEQIADYLEFGTDAEESTKRSTIRPALNHLAKAELEFGKSLCDFSKSDLEAVFVEKNWVGKSFAPKRTIVRQFAQWDTLQNGVMYEMDFGSFELEDNAQMAVYKSSYFATEEDFASILEKLLAKKGKLVRGVALCALYWLGFSRKEALNAKIEDINDGAHTVIGREMSDDLYKIIRKCADTTSYFYDNGTTSTGLKMFINTGYIIKLCDDNTSTSGNVLTDASANKQMRYLVQEMEEIAQGGSVQRKIFKQKCLNENGKFCKMYDYETKVGNRNYFEESNFTQNEDFFRNVCYDKSTNCHNYAMMIRSYNLWKMCYKVNG